MKNYGLRGFDGCSMQEFVGASAELLQIPARVNSIRTNWMLASQKFRIQICKIRPIRS